MSFSCFSGTWSRLRSAAVLAVSLLSPATSQAAFNAADHGTVALHLIAEDLALTHGAEVTAWGPLTASGSQTPTYRVTEFFNGRPAVSFSGDVMKGTGVNLTAQTIFAVVSLGHGAPALGTLISNGTEGQLVRRDAASYFYRSPGNTLDATDFVGGLLPGSLSVNQVPSGEFVLNSPHLMMATAGAPQTYSDFWVGAGTLWPPNYWNGSVAEIIVYSGELSPKSIEKVGWYLQEKYELPTHFTGPSPTIDFKASSGAIQSSKGVLSTSGAPVTLSWSTTKSDTLSIDQDVQAATATGAGSVVVSPSVTTTYTLTASNEDLTATHSITVYIGESTQPAVLSEFLASNAGGLDDEDGESPDWIEIRNPNPFAIDLAGYRLEDSQDHWTFPAGSLIEGDGYRVVFASGKNRTNPAGNLHTNFSLGTEGEHLALKAAGGAVITEFNPAYPVQEQNVSAGQAGGVAIYYAEPTPGAANGSPVNGVTAKVEFSVPHGFYDTSFLLNLSCPTPDSVIRITMNGSTPTETNGSIYTAPLVISSTRTLRARAFRTGFMPSPVTAQSYLFLNDVLANQNYATGSAPLGWPTSTVNGQTFRYGWNSTLKAQYTTQQLIDGLKQIPTVSLLTDQANLTDATKGIYVNADRKGDEWERPVSVEYLPADGSDSFRINAGLRIRGGNSRNDGFPKHSLRLHFRGKYGEPSLKFALHGSGGTGEFETLDLRTEQNYHWANQNFSSDGQNTAVHEVFCRDLMGAIGQPTTRSRYVHLYLNGQYWGLYQSEERAQEDYGATYFGGKADDYDVIQTSSHPYFIYEVNSGQVDAWQTLWNLSRQCGATPSAANYFAILGRQANGQRDPAMPVYLDVDNLISYMLVTYYTGDGDAPLAKPLAFNQANNWRGMRRREGTEGFRFFVHDAEHTLLTSGWVDDRLGISTGGSNRSIFLYSNPEWIHQDLRGNGEYRVRFGDIVQKHLFNGGAMTPTVARALFDARAAQIGQAIIPDAARWGTNAGHSLSGWQSRLNTIRGSFFPSRTSNLINSLRNWGFYPNTSAPVFSKRGGSVAPNFTLTMTASSGATIYYTLDGSDPRAVGGAIVGTAYSAPGISINGVVTVRARARSSTGTWSALDEARFVAFPAAVPGDLVVSKIHYHPDNPSEEEEAAGYGSDSDFEYVELLNISDHTVDLSAVSFTTGIGFNFATSPVVALPAGERVLIARNPAALQFRYGPGLPVAGAFSDDLSNAGETLRLAGTANATLKEFAYDDVSPWPRSPDGDGFALVLKSPASNPAAGQGGNWRASNERGGKPGTADLLDRASWRGQHFAPEELADPELEASLWGDEADPDGDGVVNLIEMVTGSSPLDEGSRVEPELSWWTDPGTQERYFTVAFRVREDLSGVTIVAQGSSDLKTWPDTLEMAGAPVEQGDGTLLYRFREAAPDSESRRRFVRIQASMP